MYHLRCEEGIVRVERKTAGNVTILAFAGEFDAANVPSTIEEIDGLIEGSLRLVFNFRELTFIDSSGLGYVTFRRNTVALMATDGKMDGVNLARRMNGLRSHMLM